MKTIWKYQLEVADRMMRRMPKGAKILHLENQYDFPCIWALVDTEVEMEERIFSVVGTGLEIKQDMGVNWEYVGSFQQLNGMLVWHLFEVSL